MARTPGPSLTRAAVIDAAVALVEDGGAEALVMRELARRLGVQASTLYHHVPSQDALRHAVAVEGWRRLVAVLDSGGDDVETVLRRLAADYRQFALAHPGLYALMNSVPFDPTDPELLAVTRAGADRLNALGWTDPDALIHAIRSLRSAVHGFITLELAGQMRLAVSADDTFAWWTDVVLAGLRTKGLVPPQ